MIRGLINLCKMPVTAPSTLCLVTKAQLTDHLLVDRAEAEIPWPKCFINSEAAGKGNIFKSQ